MSTHQENQPRREQTWIYVTAVVLLAVAVVAALIIFSSARDTVRAEQKADELIASLEEAGARTPDRDQVVRVLGDDGGASCQEPNSALRRATLHTLIANGAAGPGARPVVGDGRAVRAQALIIEVYCPDELDEFVAYVESLRTDDLVRN